MITPPKNKDIRISIPHESRATIFISVNILRTYAYIAL